MEARQPALRAKDRLTASGRAGGGHEAHDHSVGEPDEAGSGERHCRQDFWRRRAPRRWLCNRAIARSGQNPYTA